MNLIVRKTGTLVNENFRMKRKEWKKTIITFVLNSTFLRGIIGIYHQNNYIRPLQYLIQISCSRMLT